MNGIEVVFEEEEAEMAVSVSPEAVVTGSGRVDPELARLMRAICRATSCARRPQWSALVCEEALV